MFLKYLVKKDRKRKTAKEIRTIYDRSKEVYLDRIYERIETAARNLDKFILVDFLTQSMIKELLRDEYVVETHSNYSHRITWPKNKNRLQEKLTESYLLNS